MLTFIISGFYFMIEELFYDMWLIGKYWKRLKWRENGEKKYCIVLMLR